ncbi:MAG: hypothetical protein BIFFINMI_00010 [Phycisphaerae bacterium]|nr:hypothetical protein [Phycisphaerae bacterium]
MSDTATVALETCRGYAPDMLEPALDRLLGSLGGLERFVQPGQRVLLKPNCIAGRPPEKATQTDGAVILSLARRAQALGAQVLVGDSPAWGTIQANLHRLGVHHPLQEMGVQVVDFRNARRVDTPPHCHYSHFLVASEALAADVVINLPKLKAHKQLGLTAAIKNMFGCVAGKRKAFWHFSAGDRSNCFGWMLVELLATIAPALTIVDGVLGQQGNGPIDGEPRAFNWLIAGADAVAAERVCAELLGIAPDELRTLRAAVECGIGCADLARIEVLGERIESLRIDDFVRPDMMPIKFPLFRIARSALKNIFLRNGVKAG